MKPEPRGVALELLIAGFAFAVVLAIAQLRPADLEAPGLKFVSPGIARSRHPRKGLLKSSLLAKNCITRRPHGFIHVVLSRLLIFSTAACPGHHSETTSCHGGPAFRY